MPGGEIAAVNFVNKLKKGVEDGAGNVTNAAKELGGEGLNKITTATGPALAKGKDLMGQVPSMGDIKNMGGQAYDQHVANTQASNAEVGVNPDMSIDTNKLANYVGDKVNPVKNMGRIINVLNAAGDGYKDQKQKFQAGEEAGRKEEEQRIAAEKAAEAAKQQAAKQEGGRRRRRRRRTRRKKRRKSRKSRRRRRKSRKKFKKHYMWNKKGKRYRVKTYKQHIKGVRLGHTHKKPKKSRRRRRR